MTKILFIINPISGGKDKTFLEKYIPDYYSKLKINTVIRILFTEYGGHAREIASTYKNDYDKIVAVGGDGTMNEVAGALVNSDVAFGIIPTGSGNGLARHLSISLKLDKALSTIVNGKQDKIDCGIINDNFFFCTCGVGFDAHIGHVFAHTSKRGFLSYLKLVLREFWKYKPEEYNVIIDGKVYTKKAFVITVANASQYGNNAFIAPLAKLEDGLLDVVVLKPFCLFHVPGLVLRIFSKTMHKSRLVEIIKAKKIRFSHIKSGEAHFDGEPYNCGNEVKIKVIVSALNIIVP